MIAALFAYLCAALRVLGVLGLVGTVGMIVGYFLLCALSGAGESGSAEEDES